MRCWSRRGRRALAVLPFILAFGPMWSPGAALAQPVTDRTPNLDTGWIGPSGLLHLNVVHRFWLSGGGDDRKLVNSPTILLAGAPTAAILVGTRYASNALVADRFNEWEAFVRWAPPGARSGDGGLQGGITLAWNAAAGSLDGELSASHGLGTGGEAGGPPRVRLVAAARAHSDAAGSGATGGGGAVGAVVHLTPHTALSADVGLHAREGVRPGRSWGAGLQLRIPTTPHSLSVQAANTRTSTIQGASLPGRTTWGFEFTVPVTPARYLGRRTGNTVEPPAAARAAGADARVTMSEDLRFVPDTVRIRVGERVHWMNTSALPHTVTAHPDRVRDPGQVELPEGAEPFDSGIVLPGEGFVHRFERAGTYRYVCTPHDLAGMVGVVVVEP
jgi:plastocyanin